MPEIIFLIIIIVLERIVPYRKLRVFKTGFLSDVTFYLFFQPAVLDLILVDFLRKLPETHRFTLISHYPTYIQFVIAFLVLELVYYIIHRFMHNIGLLWRFHEVHHSSTEINWLSVARNHAIDVILSSIADTVIFILLGVDIKIAVLIGSINGMYGVWKHCNVKIKLGVLQYIFISPEMHRCHHIAELKYQKANFGNTLSIYDWLFGTAYYPDEKDYVNMSFGTTQEYPQNFIKQNIHVFRRMK